MKIRLYFFGKHNELTDRETELVRRIGFRCPIEVVALPQAGISDIQKNKEKEAETLLQKISGRSSYLILFDERGSQMDSVEFSTFLKKKLVDFGEIAFVIGGAYGLHQTIRDQAKDTIAFGRMVWTRELCRHMALEQLYRALEIDGGSHFHKE